MLRNIKANLAKASWWDFFFLIFLSCIIVFFLVINANDTVTDSWTGATVFFVPFILIFCFWLYFLSGFPDELVALRMARVSLLPVLTFLLLIPYSYFFAQQGGMKPWVCLGIVLMGAIIFNKILRRNSYTPITLILNISILLVVYTLFFSIISVLRHLNYQNASSFDVAIYSQLQWNNIHGHFFHTSFSGSNFVTHNSPFLILLSPFYALYPRPENLLILKTFFLALSAIPFYLIMKEYVNRRSIFPMVAAYLFFPFIVGQNFNAPHETCFLPPLLLFSYYYFIKGSFKKFLLFLLLSLSVKEHMALIAIMYGLYAMYLKKEKKWIIVPILLGFAWGAFSMWVIYYFQKIYHVDPYPAWLIDNIKRRFLRPDHSLVANIIWGLQTSIVGHWCNFLSVYLVLSPVCVILPFFSSIWILGLPEFGINLLATIPLSYPTWHYDIVASIFLLIACASAIRKISLSPWLGQWSIPRNKIQELLSWFLCVCILGHFFLWWDYTKITINPRYVATMNTAIAMLPQDASVSLTKHLAAYVTDKKDYFLCEDKRKGDYIVLDKNESMGICVTDNKRADQYIQIFNEDGIRVYKNKIGTH